MFILKFIFKPIPLAAIIILAVIAVGPTAALSKQVQGKGTVEITAASSKEEPAKKKASQPANQGLAALTGKCKEHFEEYKDWDSYYKAFALGISGDRMACAFSEGGREAVETCNDELKGIGIFNTHCALYAKADSGTIIILGKIDTEHTQSKKTAPKADTEVTQEVKTRALRKAKLSAWNTYIKKTFGAAKQRTYIEELKNKMVDQLDEFLVSYVPLDAWVNKDAGTYTLLINAEIDDGQVNAFFLAHSRAATQDSGEGSAFAIIFQARRATSMKSIEKRTTKIKAAEGTQSTKEAAVAKGGSVVSGTTNKSMSRTDTGGSSIRQGSRIQYEIISAKYVGTTMDEILSVAGFETIPYRELSTDCGAPNSKLIKESYIHGDELPDELWADIKAAMKDCEIKFLAVGTLDIDTPNTDPSRGNIVVTTRALAKVYMAKKRGKRTLLRSVASYGPAQIKGWGDDDMIASTNSLRQAAKLVATDIVDQLNQKGLR